MIKDFERIYRQLRYWELARTQSEFSTAWLGQCPSYFSSIKARGIAPNPHATMTLISRLRRHNGYLKQTDLPRTSVQLGQLSQMLEQEADGLFNRLEDVGVQRVVERNVGGGTKLKKLALSNF